MEKFGRPPKPEGEACVERQEIRVRSTDKALFERAAAAANLTVSAWIRTRLIELAEAELSRKSRRRKHLREGH